MDSSILDNLYERKEEIMAQLEKHEDLEQELEWLEKVIKDAESQPFFLALRQEEEKNTYPLFPTTPHRKLKPGSISSQLYKFVPQIIARQQGAMSASEIHKRLIEMEIPVSIHYVRNWLGWETKREDGVVQRSSDGPGFILRKTPEDTAISSGVTEKTGSPT